MRLAIVADISWCSTLVNLILPYKHSEWNSIMYTLDRSEVFYMVPQRPVLYFLCQGWEDSLDTWQYQVLRYTNTYKATKLWLQCYIFYWEKSLLETGRWHATKLSTYWMSCYYRNVKHVKSIPISIHTFLTIIVIIILLPSVKSPFLKIGWKRWKNILTSINF